MPTKYQNKYNMRWPIDPKWDDLSIELECIKRGGTWLARSGATCGAGLFHHFMAARALLWPDRYRHRWTDLIYTEILANMMTILMGPASSQKTSHACEWALIDYWANPDNTIVLISTTTMEKLDLAIFGELKMLHQRAQEKYPYLAGHILEARKAISTDDLEGGDVRDIRKGIVARACYIGRSIDTKTYVGIGAAVYAGTKQQRIRFIADELQFMPATFFQVLPNMINSANLDANLDPQIKIIGSGNPKHDPSDQLSIAAEPIEGWPSVKDIEKTTCWDTRFYKGRCVNLIGTDSPNFDTPEGIRPPFDGLINRYSIKVVEHAYSKNSMQFYSQCVGKMMMNFVGKRVLTKEVCEEHGAFSSCVWKNTSVTRIGFLDPAWGGDQADRCIWGYLEFGNDQNDKEVIRFCEYKNIPLIMTSDVLPDDQIAEFIKREAHDRNILPANIFYDSTGRGTTGAAFARVFGSTPPVPIAFGDKPTSRPVRYDMFVTEPNGMRRLKRCDEEYGKFVSEMWFAVRHIVECGQMRELDPEVVREFSMREYMIKPGNKTDVETKDITKKRMGCSPDLADAFAVGVEGARQRGFHIRRLGEDVISEQGDPDAWITEDATTYHNAIKSRLLTHI